MPLRVRLALWYGGLAGLVAVLVSLFAYATHSRAHYDELDGVLVGVGEHTAQEYAAAATPEERAAMFAVPIGPNLAARIYDANGKLLAAGPNASRLPAIDPQAVLARPAEAALDLLIGLAPPLMAPKHPEGSFGLAVDPGGLRWRVYVLPLEESAQYLLLAAPLDNIDASIATYRGLVPILAFAGAIISLIGGGLVAGSALQPVAALTATAEAIAGSRSFSNRVTTTSRRDELGRLATTFNEMLNSLEQAYRAQQRFVADASHELRAPLTAIQANLELLERRPNMAPAERQKAVDEAGREARRLVHLVADLLALARADAGVPLRRQRVELDRVLLDALGEARHLAGGQRLEVGQIEPILVEGDPDRLKQLLLILLDNALKYTPSTGQVLLNARRHGACAELEVRDSGVGIPPSELPRVFDRFYRADPARSRDPGGTGLGLPIARWIAQQHGGDVILASTPGEGTTATIRLPVRA